MSYSIIIHVSDLHIRYDQDRIEEYSDVFEKLGKNITEQIKKKKALIICTGDIIHDRYKINPSVIYLVNKFIKIISDIGHLVIIDGNHDISVGKEHEKRLLQVIKKPSNVEYIDKTGEYTFNNVTAGVSTLVDNEFISYEEIKKKDNDIVIGMGHYTLTEWLEERCLPTSNRTKSVKDFDGYKHVLLGDIHSRKKYGNCRYSGSLIQQNFGETSISHGYSLLDIKKDKWKNIDIPSDYTFKNVYIENNGDFVYTGEFTKYSYIKLHYPAKFSHLEEDYKNKIEDLTVIKRFMTNVVTNSDNILTRPIDEKTLDSDNLSEEKIIESIITDPKKLTPILELHKKYTVDTGYNYSQNKSKWYLKKLTFENILKYRGKHEINFDNIDGIVGISGLNTSGKSSLLKILIFGLCGEITIDFSQVSTEYTKVSQHHNHYRFDNIHMLNYNNPLVKKGSVEVIIEHDNKIYKIKREIERRTTAISTKSTVLDDNDKIIHTSSANNKSRITEKEVNKYIYNLIGRSTDLYSLNVINKNSGSFSEMTDMARFNIISNLFNLNIYNDIAKNVKDDISSLKERILKSKGRKEQVYEPLNIDIDSIDIDQIKEKLKRLTERRALLKTLRCDRIDKKYVPKIIEINDSYISSKFDELLINKQKFQKMITDDIPDCISAKPPPSMSRSQIFKEYKQVCHINDIVEIPKIDELPKPCKTNVKESDINKISLQMSEYKYDIEELLKDKSEYEHILAKYKIKNSDNISEKKHIDIPNITDFPDIDCKLKKLSFPEKIIKDLNIEELNEKIESIETLPLKHIGNIKTITYNRETLNSTIEKAMDKVDKYTNIDDILISIRKGKLKKEHLQRLENLKDLNKVIIDISEEISESSKNLKILDIDEQYNKQIELDKEYNLKSKSNKEKKEELEKLIDEKKKWEHNQELKRITPYFDEIIRRLNYISLFNQYNTLKEKYLQNIAYLDECNKKYQKKIEYEQYLKYYNEDALKNINKIDKELSNIYNTAQLQIESIDKDIIDLESKIKAKNSILNINDSLEELMAEMDILTLYNKVITESIKASILSKFLEQISMYANEILQDLVSYEINLSVSIDPNEKSNKIKLSIIRDNNSGAHSLSAYEEFCLNLIIKIVLNTFSSTGTATFLVLDETLEVIDSINKPKIEKVFALLKRRYKNILLITHIKEFFNGSDHMILVKNGTLEFK